MKSFDHGTNLGEFFGLALPDITPQNGGLGRKAFPKDRMTFARNSDISIKFTRQELMGNLRVPPP